MTIIIHPGAPRTGTTVLQKHLFPKAKKTIIYSKRAYKSSGKTTDKEKAISKDNIAESKKLIKLAETSIDSVSPEVFATEIIIKNSLMASNNERRGKENFALLCKAMKILGKLSEEKQQNVLISSERLCDTTASLFGYSSHQWEINSCHGKDYARPLSSPATPSQR